MTTLTTERLGELSPFMQGFILGLTGPIHLLSLRGYRKGQRYMLGPIARTGIPFEIREDFTRWNSIRFRWMLWFAGLAAWPSPALAARGGHE